MKEITECIVDIGKANHFFDVRPHIRFLANTIGQRLSTMNGVHHSGQRSISVDDTAKDAPQMPRKLSTSNGRGAVQYLQCHGVHQQFTSAHKDT